MSQPEKMVTVSRGEVNWAVRSALRACGAIFPVTGEHIAGATKEYEDSLTMPEGLKNPGIGETLEQTLETLPAFAQNSGELRVMSQVLAGLGLNEPSES